MTAILICQRLRFGRPKPTAILSAACSTSSCWPGIRRHRNYSHGQNKAFPDSASSKTDGASDDSSDVTNKACRSYLDSSNAPLSMLPLGMVLRSLVTSAVSSAPLLLPVALRILSVLAYNKTALFNPDSNRALRYALDKTLYKQFCAGESATDVRSTVKEVKRIGFTGAILAYAKESPNQPAEEMETISHEIIGNTSTGLSEWLENSLKTVRLAEPGDFVAFKFTGAGTKVRNLLLSGSQPTPDLEKAIDHICQQAKERRVRVLVDGEQDKLQRTIDDWTIQTARKFNSPHENPLIFGTYQSYKKTTPSVLSHHLALAQREDFSLGVKLVRGAYLASDPPNILQDNKASTDKCYDTCAASVLTRQWNSAIKGVGEYPSASIIFATHNATSVRRAYEIYRTGQAKSEILFAQLQGMADEISCELVQINRDTQEPTGSPHAKAALPIYKYMAWGTTGECMKYLLRRAEENKDAVKRTQEDRDAMWVELVRRVKSTLSKT